MKCIYCNNDFTEDDAKNENMTPRWKDGNVIAVHMECPEAEPYKFKYYLHGDDELFEMVETLTDQGIPESVAEKIAEQRPFYEVTFECEYSPTTEEVKFVKVTP